MQPYGRPRNREPCGGDRRNYDESLDIVERTGI